MLYLIALQSGIGLDGNLSPPEAMPYLIAL
jgi:hypothetical protein